MNKVLLKIVRLTCLGSSFFWFKNAPTPQYLSRDKTKRQSGKNTALTPTKTLPKKQGHSLVDFQIVLFTYKLDSQYKNYIYKIKTYIYIYMFGYKIGPLKKKKKFITRTKRV